MASRRFISFFLLASLVLFGCVWVSSKADETEDYPDVVVLTGKNFDEHIKKHPVTLVAFVASWCGHCKRLKPEYAKAATELKDKVPLAIIDAAVETDVAGKFEIEGYPTMKLFRNAKPEDYAGGRTSAEIVNWINRMTSPAVTEVADAAAAVALALKEEVAVVGSFKAKDNAAAVNFGKVADESRMLGAFISFVGDKDEVSVYRLGEGQVASTTETEPEKLREFLSEERLPYFGEISGSNYQDLEKRNLPFVWFAGTRENYDAHAPVIREAGKVLRGKFLFVWLDVAKFGGHAENNLGFNKKYPGLLLDSRNRDFKPSGRFMYPAAQGFDDHKKIVQFLDDVVSGKIPAELKSEEIPETNDEAVKVVVGKNFDTMVTKSGKHVLLEIYAPWCGHCKKFAKDYEAIAMMFENNKDVIVAKIDGTANEITSPGFSYSGFPTIYAIPKGSDPVLHSGAREKDAVAQWFAETVGIEVPKVDESKDGKDEL